MTKNIFPKHVVELFTHKILSQMFAFIPWLRMKKKIFEKTAFSMKTMIQFLMNLLDS